MKSILFFYISSVIIEIRTFYFIQFMESLKIYDKISKTFNILRKAYDAVVRVKTISRKTKKCSHLFWIMVKNRKILIFAVRLKTVVRLLIIVA